MPWHVLALVFLPILQPLSAAPPGIRLELPPYQLKAEEREIVAACLVLEAASLGEFGMHAVMAVIRNRARGRPELFAHVVLQPRQFSALNPQTAGSAPTSHAVRRARSDPGWIRALELVQAAAAGPWHDPTGGATHFTLTGRWTAWSRQLTRTTVIGRHSFFR